MRDCSVAIFRETHRVLVAHCRNQVLDRTAGEGVKITPMGNDPALLLQQISLSARQEECCILGTVAGEASTASHAAQNLGEFLT